MCLPLSLQFCVPFKVIGPLCAVAFFHVVISTYKPRHAQSENDDQAFKKTGVGTGEQRRREIREHGLRTHCSGGCWSMYITARYFSSEERSSPPRAVREEEAVAASMLEIA